MMRTNVLTRAGISLVTAATFASGLAHGQSSDTQAQQAPKEPLLAQANETGPGQTLPQAEPNGENGGTLQEVTVTGSRIVRTDGFGAPTPVAVMDSDILKEVATTTIGASLNPMPQLSSNLSSSNLSSNVGTGTAG